MPKGTILDRLAGAMKTLGKREGKAFTPRQRVAAAQRWNSLNEIAEREDDRLYDVWERNRQVDPNTNNGWPEFKKFHEGIYRLGLPDEGATGANPFLSRIPEKYNEQDNFLYWCKKNGYAPTQENLKRYRWEEYQFLPHRVQQWIANKDAIRQGIRDEGFVSPFTDDLRTLEDLDNAIWDYSGSKYDFMKLPVYKSYEEFPDDFDYMWRY